MIMYPNKTASQLTMKLSEFIDLDGKWEVGLLEMSFPGKVKNGFLQQLLLHTVHS